ncbi:hypothetical protein [Paracoccus mutanolyticus]|uniref:hypothetical protein n=1 Tax=Paracoccus mutanolyticus TaxID=1499308 RepID=UPI0011AE509A|nr:hypothetical protein [Paracoccus mutanolyticus]
MATNVGVLKATLGLDAAGFSSGIAKAKTEITGLKDTADKASTSAFRAGANANRMRTSSRWPMRRRRRSAPQTRFGAKMGCPWPMWADRLSRSRRGHRHARKEHARAARRSR